MISIHDDKTDVFVKEIETLYLDQLRSVKGISGPDIETEFSITQNIVKAVNYFSETDPVFFYTMRVRIKNYFKHLAAFHLNDEDISLTSSSFANNLVALLLLVFGFPVYLFGLINNILPFEIPGWLAVRFVKSKDYKGAVGMVLGIFTFPFFYSLQIFLVYYFSGNILLSLLYGLSLPLTGFFAYYYWHTFHKVKAKWLLIALFRRRTRAMELLIQERGYIIREFEKAKEDFFAKFPELFED